MSYLIKCLFPTSPTGNETKWCPYGDICPSFPSLSVHTTTILLLFLHYSITIYQPVHPSHSTICYCSIYLPILPTFSSDPFNPSFYFPPLLFYPSPSCRPYRELAGWSWRRRWRRGQVVTTMTSGGADAVPDVAARRRWTIWDSAPSMAVSVCWVFVTSQICQ